LSERPGVLRLHSLPSAELLSARNTLTQRSIGPVSIPTAVLDINGMRAGDKAGLALMNAPYAWIGVSRKADGLNIEQFDQLTGKTISTPFKGTRIWLRAHCDFLAEKARFSYSIDGKKFEEFGDEFTMIFQLRTFQGIRYSLFCYNTKGGPGGYADFDKFTVDEVYPKGLREAIPFGQIITISTYDGNCVLAVKDGVLTAVSVKEPLVKSSAGQFKVIDCGLGRVALQSGDGVVSVAAPGSKGQVTLKRGQPGDAETFQWTENVYGDLMLLSLITHRHLRINPKDRAITADCPGPKPDRRDGSCLIWESITSATK
jgi:xylan 1,4-beta-xylosidase